MIVKISISLAKLDYSYFARSKKNEPAVLLSISFLSELMNKKIKSSMQYINLRVPSNLVAIVSRKVF